MLSRSEVLLFAIMIFIMIIGFVLISTQNVQITKLNDLESNIYNKISDRVNATTNYDQTDTTSNQTNNISNQTNNEYNHTNSIPNQINVIPNQISNRGVEIDELSIGMNHMQPVNRMPIVDPVKMYDYRVLEDPMKDPKRRISRYSLGNILPNPAFNFPTRGPRDTFSQQGYLVDKHASPDDPNKILQLFGRQKWANSNQYEYYVTFQSGVHERKYELEKHKKELYNKDEVKIDILNNRRYEVKLFKHETMDYNPYWI